MNDQPGRDLPDKPKEFNPAQIHNAPVATIPRPKETLRTYLEHFDGIIANALPKHMDPGKMVSVVLTAVSSNSGILKCSFASIMGAVVKASQLGLYPDGMLGHAYIVPFRDKNGKLQATLIPGYKGLTDLAYRSGRVESVSARAVYKKDLFDYEFGLNERLKHVPAPGKDRGELTHAYCVLKMKDGGHLMDVMTVGEAEFIRDNFSKQPRGTLWGDNFPAAVIKTCVRRCMKLAPLSPEMAQAVHLDEMADSGLPQNLDLDLPLEMEAQGDTYIPKEQAATQSTVDQFKNEQGLGGAGA